MLPELALTSLGAFWFGCCPVSMTAVPPLHTGRVFAAAQAGLELLDVPFILLQPAGLMGQISVHVHAFCSLSSILLHSVMAVGSETDLFIWCLCSLYRSSFLMPDCSSCVLSARHH